jgi:hypothetical protein
LVAGRAEIVAGPDGETTEIHLAEIPMHWKHFHDRNDNHGQRGAAHECAEDDE